MPIVAIRLVKTIAELLYELLQCYESATVCIVSAIRLNASHASVNHFCCSVAVLIPVVLCC